MIQRADRTENHHDLPADRRARRAAAGMARPEPRHVEGARAGDAACLELLAEQAHLLGSGFTSLAHLYSPERIVMGGGVSKGFDLLSSGIDRVIALEAMPPFRDIKVVPAALGDNSGLIGAAALALAAL